jgi:hypothetical protein
MTKNPTDSFEIIKRMLDSNEKPVEFYHVNDLKFLNLKKPEEKLLEFIIKQNKEGYAPFYRELLQTGIYSDYDIINRFSHSLEEKGILITPNVAEIGYLVHERKNGRINFNNGPINVLQYLYSLSPSRNTSWNKIFTKKLHVNSWPKAHITLLYDDGGAIPQACFPGRKLNYVPKRLTTTHF